MGNILLYTIPISLILLTSVLIIPAHAEILLTVGEEYKKKETILILGKITGGGSTSSVTITISNNDRTLRSDTVIPTSDGSFSLGFDTREDIWIENKTYTVIAFSQSGQTSEAKTFVLTPRDVQPSGSLGGSDTNGISEIKESQTENEDTIELIQNGDFEEGLKEWKVGVFEYDTETYPEFDNYFDCDRDAPWDRCKASGWGFPKYGLTDSEHPGERDFYANVPAFVYGWRTGVSLEQDIDVPKLRKAALSFDVWGLSTTQLHIYVKDRSNGELNLINQLIVQDERWKLGEKKHREYDMTAYSGKPITLLMVASESVIPERVEWEDKRTTVYLDDISLTAQVPVVSSNTFDNYESFWLVILIPIIGGIIIGIGIKLGKKGTITPPMEKPYSTKPDHEPKPERTPPKVVEPKKPKLERTPPKVVEPKKYVPEEPILETGKSESDLLKQKEPVEKVASKDEKPVEKQPAPTYSDQDYVHAISLSKELQCLWVLSKEPTHRFPNRNTLLSSIAKLENKTQITNRSPYYKAIKTIVESGLVEFEGRAYGEGYRETGEISINQKGLDLIQKARNEKVTTWQTFEEKYLS